MTQDKHSPLPWSYNAGKRNGYWPYLERGKSGCNVIQDKNGSVETATADAAFIVRACNNHYQLVELAEKVASLNPEAGEIGDGMLRNLVSLASQALSNAKGGIDPAA